MRRLHPLSAGYRALGMAVTFGGLAVTLGFGLIALLEWDGAFLLAIGVAILGIGAGVALGVAQYYRFAYEVDGDTLSIESGVFDRQERDIPLGRIQNVDIKRDLLNRLLGVAVVQFETAGGSSTEGVLSVVALEEARRLQDAVARGKREDREDSEPAEGAAPDAAADTAAAGDAATAEAERAAGEAGVSGPDETATGESGTGAARRSAGEEEELFHLDSSGLALLAGVSVRPSAPFLVIFGLPFFSDIALSLFAESIIALGGPEVESLEQFVGLPPIEMLLLGVIGAVQLFLVTWVASALITANAYYDFRLTQVGNDLRYERGFLNRYSGTIPLEKIQTVTVRENVLMRRFNYGSLALETAGYGPGQSGGDGANTAIPLDDRETVIALAERLGDVTVPDVERPPRRARRRYAVRFGLVVLGITAVLWAVSAFLWTHPWWIALLGLVVAPLAGHYRWKHRGHALSEPAFVARQGFWRRQTRLVPYYRIQTAIDERTVFQRWRNLASVTADTASTASIVGGDATAHDIEEAEAQSLHPTLLDRLQEDLFGNRREGDEDGESGTPAD